MLQPSGSDLWLADGAPITAAAGFHYPTRMAVIRLHDGGLVLWSPIALSPSLSQQIDELGPVAHLIAPNDLHHMYMQDWVAAYPDAQVYAAPGLATKRDDLRIDHTLDDTPPEVWAGQIDQVVLRGNKITTEVVFFHRDSSTALFTDLLQKLPKDWFSGWRGLVARLDLMTGDEATVPRKFRVAQRDKTAGRAAVSAIMGWHPVQVVMAHGKPVTHDTHAFLVRAFGWLMPRR